MWSGFSPHLSLFWVGGLKGPGEKNWSCHPLLLVHVIPNLSLKQKTRSQEPTWQPPSFDRPWVPYIFVLPWGLVMILKEGALCRLPVIVNLATRVLRVIAGCWTKPCHSWPGIILWQMPEEELGRWYPWWSYVLSGNQVLKSACRQKLRVINSCFEKSINYRNIRSM